MAVISMSKFPPNDFWDFSCKVYARDGAADTCLRLQDEFALNVNVVLLCLWFGESGRGRFEADELDRVLSAVESWHKDVVLPLRAVRRRLKEGVRGTPRHLADDLGGVASESELYAERVEQLMLHTAVSRPGVAMIDESGQAGDAAYNLRQYIERAASGDSEDAREAAIRLLAIAFPAGAGTAVSIMRAGTMDN